MTKDKKVPIVAERMRMLRMQAGLSQAEMGRIAGVSKSSISEYENGDTPVNMDVLTRYAEYFGVGMDYLTGASSKGARATVPLFSSQETELILDYRRKSRREQKIMRMQAMSDEEYERLYGHEDDRRQPAALVSDREDTSYPSNDESDKKKK